MAKKIKCPFCNVEITATADKPSNHKCKGLKEHQEKEVEKYKKENPGKLEKL